MMILCSSVQTLKNNIEKSLDFFHLDRVRSRIVTAIRNTVKGDLLVCLTGQCKLIDMDINLYVTVRRQQDIYLVGRKKKY